MKRGNNYRLLKLKEILFKETDVDHELDIYEIKEKLLEATNHKSLDLRTIKQDMDTLEKMDFEIVKNRGKFGKIFYSHHAKLFEVYQLRLIVDAILSARFITTNEKTILIDKLKQLTSEHTAKTLPCPVLFSQSINLDYELIKLNIDRVHSAIAEQKVLAYQYGNYNLNKQFEYRRDGSLYYVEPYALIWQNDFYYLIGRFQKTGEIRHYRLDRIRNIQLTNEKFKKESFDLQTYVNQTFHMFAGEEIMVKIRFSNDLLNVVIDRFGLGVDIHRDGEEHFILKTHAKLSDGLMSWILMWGDRAQVLAPDSLVVKLKEEVNRMNNLYDN